MGLIFNLDMDASPVSFSSCIMRNCSACAQVMSFSPFYSFENVCVLPNIDNVICDNAFCTLCIFITVVSLCSNSNCIKDPSYPYWLILALIGCSLFWLFHAFVSCGQDFVSLSGHLNKLLFPESM